VSFDDGGAWQSLQLNLPVTPIHDIAVKDHDVVVGTHGRSFHVLDNISVLRQLNPTVAGSAVHLFEPAAATRSVSRGAAIDYYLKGDAEQVTVEILDGQGQMIRSFTGTAEEEKKRAAQAGAGEEESFFRGGPPAHVGVKAGMNRFTWDLRHPPATEFPNLVLWAGSTRGPIAPPGTYGVRITTSGQSQTRPFRLQRHPLGSASDADLKEQFALARQIHARVSEANQAVIRIRALKDQIADRTDKARTGRVVQVGATLMTKLTEIEGEIYQYRNQSNQDPLNYPIKLNNKLAALQGMVEYGDARPTDQAYAVFKELSARLDAQLSRLESTIGTELVAFNALLRSRRLPVVQDAPPNSAAAVGGA
jgi:hypothetical protein